MKKLVENKKTKVIIAVLIVLILIGCLVGIIKYNKNSSENNLQQDNDKEELKSEINNNEEQELDESIDYESLEKYIAEAAIMYVNENYSFTEKEIVEEIELSLLVKKNYIKDKSLQELYNDGVCDAYSIVKANVLETTGKTYLKCKNYITDGYDDNHLKNDANKESNDKQPDKDEVDDNLNSSEKPKEYVIENYVGKNYLIVKKQLEGFNLNVKVEMKDISGAANSGNYTKETIIGQSVASGKILSEGDSITLYIPRVVVRYPNFCDGSYTVNKVQEFANSNNLILTIEYEDNPKYEKGTIFYQSKIANTNVIEGTRLIIKVAK